MYADVFNVVTSKLVTLLQEVWLCEHGEPQGTEHN